MRLKTLLFAVSLFAVLGCTPDKKEQKMQVAVTILPQKYLVEQIVGDSIEVVCAIPQGSSPEEYSATPEQIRAISASKIYFEIGELGFEKTTLPSILKNSPNIEVVTLSENINFIESRCGDESHSHYDPHYWSSPQQVKIMANNIYRAIIEEDSANAPYYASNHTKLQEQLSALDAEVKDILSSSQGRTFAIFHPSLSYFARDYGLEQLSLEEAGKEMTPHSMKQAIERARARGVKTVFIQNEFNPLQVKTFVDEIGAKSVVINPLAYDIMNEIIKVANEVGE